MQVVSHSLAHRGPSASRTRARWQPYASIPPSTVRTPSNAYFNTPATSVSSPAAALYNPTCEPESLKQLPLHPSASSLPAKEVREAHKHKYVTGLVDVAVKSLCEIWSPHDIPTAFSTPTCSAAPSVPHIVHLNGPSHNAIFVGCAQQLPSPPSRPPSSAPRVLSRSQTHADLSPADLSRKHVAPLKAFVHEVLRRSRTSCSVLQTALCYIEALRTKVPELVQQEKAGQGIRGETDQSTRVLLSDDPRLQEPVEEVDIDEIIDSSHFVNPESYFSDLTPPTVRMLDDNPLAMVDAPAWQSQGEKEKSSHITAEDLPALPPLPSPLLCPRRTFLASLILASKFMQDKCYSNRAWAKLAGLPAREIGRCERALGEALEWRLWVGKMPAQRGLPRSQSAGELFSSRGVASMDFTPSAAASAVRRSSTLPAQAFALPSAAPFLTVIPQRWVPTLEGTGSDYSPTPTLTASPATTDASDSLNEERTVQMHFVDHAPDRDTMKIATPTVTPALAYAYAGEGGIARAWNGFAWNPSGLGSGWVRGDADSVLVQH
ncbi:hypothetical protein BC834DRAFT_866579 [Gloeopeniophorella convolvens]|nr:hypothetical protein BC834DRAFT_866579 [Gloeopeniophorella convolvens]